ncbi:LacI family transcriptional regulator [Cellulosimicrobium terreum]|uniref:LacI family transcriptional regulator n=1 Tax=Cellulosimicrobium funkei TaxID=264251 RepID=A0A4Y8R7G4_9MICO|nr:LacI family transcriptional regulator [Cellulosimicrobium funkei]TGA74260.1 LacI family transcriptional regulator [Cellulosimicrobium terreum]
MPSSGPARREASRATDAPGHRRRVTIGDVADRAGVSKSLVSFVFNDRPGVSVATRERILQAAKDLGWQPSARARALSRNKTQAVGLVIRREPELLSTDPFFPQFLAGVETGLAQHDYALVLQVVGDPATERAAYERFARESRVDGVFLTDVRVADDRHQLVASLGLSSVVVAPTSASPDTDSAVVGMDDTTGVRRAVHHLYALGHRRIGHVMGAAGYVHTEARKQAWTNTLDELGIRDRAIATADFTGGSGTRATHELLDLPRPPSAIIYGNDLMAIAGISAATDRGIRVPEDLSVVGFDDIPLAPYIVPPLTTIRQDVVAWGAAAAETLVAAVEGRERPALSLPPVDFVVRGSTGRARSQPKH